MRLIPAVLILVASASSVFPQSLAPDGQQRKRAEASPASGTIRVDGRLDEGAWERATPIVDFVQKEPVENAPPTDAMSVRILYDDDAVYVGARMSASVAPDIQAPLGRRDDVGQAESVLVAFDTFRDRRTAVVFGVTAAGVRFERFHPSDREDSYDSGFDPVWRAVTTRDAGGWTAEMWIPLSQLRFSRAPEQVWGLNIRRFRPTLNEEDYWAPIPRTEEFWSSRFGELHGISNVQPGRRIGQFDAADINWASEQLRRLVDEKKIPPKVLVIHRFTKPMVLRANQITLDPRVQIVMHMDGWGPPWQKFESYRDYIDAEPVEFTGFKLFFHNDTKRGDLLLTPGELLWLRPRPLYIQYQ